MPIKSPQELLELLKQSRLLSAEQLDDVHDSMLLTNDVGSLLDMLVERKVLTEWQKAQLMAGRTGFFIGNYVLLGLLGRGGMGSVFLARHTTMNRRCAVKVVSKQVGKDPDSLDQFLTEARAIASLDHPNIVQAYDVDKENDHFYIVMEHVEGQSLEEIIKQQGVLDCESAVDCIRQAAEGLAHAHGRNMVHCDIKPSNLLVNEQGVVKILDMGMARLVGEAGLGGSNPDSRSNVKILGTVDYMAPEQAVSAPSFDFRADIYSLGCTLFALLAGHPPFDEGNLTQRILKHQTQAPPDLRKIRSDVPASLANICLKMMAKNPDDRYQSAREVANVLSTWTMPSEPVTPAKLEKEPAFAPGGEAFDQNAFGGVDATAGPTIGSVRSKNKSFFENERALIPVLVGVVILVVFVLLFIIIVSMRSDKPTEPQGVTQPTVDPTPPNPDPHPVVQEDQPVVSPNNGTKDLPEDSSKDPNEKTVKTDPTKIKDNGGKSKQPVKQSLPNPFKQLGTSVDLPQREATTPSDGADGWAFRRPLPLGHLDFPKNDNRLNDLRMKLLGGKLVLSAKQSFILKKVSENGPPAWKVFYKVFYVGSGIPVETTQVHQGQVVKTDTSVTPAVMEVKNDIPPVEIAHIWVDADNNLMFQWLNVERTIPTKYLSACALELALKKHKHRMQLLTSAQVPAWKYIPISNSMLYQTQPPVVPNLDSFRLEISGYKGPYEKVTYDPSPILSHGGKTIVTLTAKDLPTLTIHFELNVRGQLVTLSGDCTYASKEGRRGPPFRISLQSWVRIVKFSLELERQRRIREAKPNKSDLEESRLKQIVKEQEKLGNLIKTLEPMRTPTGPPADFEGLGVFQFQEYADLGKDGKVIILKTQ